MVGFCHLPHKPMSHMLFGQSVQVRGAGMRRKDSRWVMCVSCSHYKLIANPSVLSQAYGEYKKMIKAVLWSPECSSTFSLFTEQSVDTSSYRLAFILHIMLAPLLFFCSTNHLVFLSPITDIASIT